MSDASAIAEALGREVLIQDIDKIYRGDEAIAVWSFEQAAEARSYRLLTVVDEVGSELPEPAATFVRATNLARLEALLATFADGALVHGGSSAEGAPGGFFRCLEECLCTYKSSGSTRTGACL